MSKALPLAGIKVVEFSHMVMGPSCGLILADLGADVVKVEPVGEGDKTRHLPGSGAGFFPAFNRNKRSLSVNLKSTEGISLVKELIADADIVTENFRLGGLDAMGLGYEELSETNPGLIYCSLKGFLSGPYERRAALDEVVQMMGGLAYMTGPPGRPLRAGSSVNDIMGGMFAVIGIMAALQERTRTGKGQFVKSSLFENNVFLVAQHMAQFGVTGTPAAPMPARLSAWGIYDVFECAEELQVFVGVVTDTQWQAFCSQFELEQLAQDPALKTNRQRVAARASFMPQLKDLFRDLTRTEILQRCEAAGLPFAPILSPEELYADPHLQQSPGALIDVTLTDGSTVGIPALPLELHGTRLGLRRDVPRVGQHSLEIATRLGYTPEEIARLGASGVLTFDGGAPASGEEETSSSKDIGTA